MKSKNYNKVFKILKGKYFKYIELDPVIESKFILQRSGENFKKYLFSFYNSDGQELSLRPDLTISSVIRYAQSKSNKKEKVFYTGSAFRKSYNKKNVVIRQIGMEIFSSKNENKDDKEILDKSIKIIKKLGFKKATVKIGNFKLFELLIKKLSIPQRWKSRLLKFYWNEKYLSELESILKNFGIVTNNFENTLKLFFDAGHSRLPVYKGQLDNIVGMIHVKDLLPYWHKNTEFSINKVKRNVLFSSPAIKPSDIEVCGTPGIIQVRTSFPSRYTSRARVFNDTTTCTHFCNGIFAKLQV